jgi:predicted nucleotidyltransferase
VQGDILAWTFLHPDAEYSLTQLAERAGSSVRAVHHEVERLVSAGILLDRRLGNVRLVRAHTETAIARPLSDLLAVTFGPLPVLARLLAGVPGVESAFLYGSWAARYLDQLGPVPNDVDVLVIGTSDPDALYDLARTAESRLGRPVSISRVSPSTWAARHGLDPDEDPFLVAVRDGALVQVPLTAEGRSA